MAKLLQTPIQPSNLNTAFKVVADFTAKRKPGPVVSADKISAPDLNTAHSVKLAVSPENPHNRVQAEPAIKLSPQRINADRRILETIAQTSFAQLRELIVSGQTPQASDLAACRVTVVGSQRLRALESQKN